LLELLVVFVGVYAASMLAGRQARHAEVERTHVLRTAVAREVGYIRAEGDELALSPLIVYADAIAAGAHPPLQPFASRMPFSRDVWEAATASGEVQLLDPDLVIRMAALYGEIPGFLSRGDPGVNRGDRRAPDLRPGDPPSPPRPRDLGVRRRRGADPAEASPGQTRLK
jgi:hypothetical protein